LILLLTAALGAGQPFTCVPAQVWDGDTFTCADGTKVRVAAIAAREVKRVKGHTINGGWFRWADDRLLRSSASVSERST
jgi:endonuclease YncB( thermonuclease family)